MRFEVVVFDFDGTLVDSAAAKYQAFFQLFPDTPEHRAVVAGVLNEDPDGSRYQVIPRMIERMRARGLALPGGQAAEQRVAAYAALVERAVGSAPEVPGASEVLRQLRGRCAIYISSQTPEVAVRGLVEARGWAGLVAGVFGYPRDKAATVAALLGQHGIGGGQLAVVGDGTSDEEAARSNGCVFFPIRQPGDLARVGQQLVNDRA
jgi:phosphoglycolate phosphatase-like HAD superfamily hydrolase